MNTCPVCGGDRDKDHSSLELIMQKAGLSGHQLNPGGRQLRFLQTGETWLQVTDQCNACAETTILKFLRPAPRNLQEQIERMEETNNQEKKDQ